MTDTRDLVERVTREVLKRLDSKSVLPVPNIAKGSDEKILVIFSCCEDYVQEALEELQKLCKSGFKLTCLLSHGISKKLHDDDIRRYISPERIIRDDLSEGYDPDFIKHFNRVFVPILSLNTGALVAQYLSINVPAHLILRALATGIPVIATFDTMLLSDEIHPVTKIMQENVKHKLEKLGIVLVGLADSSKYFFNADEKISKPVDETISLKGKNGYETLQTAGADRVGTLGEDVSEIAAELACMIDHTLLKPESKEADIIKICEEARKYRFASVCVNPGYASLAKKELHGSNVQVCVVIGFPLGATTTMTKVNETLEAVANGADEIDMVINVGELKSGNDNLVLRDIQEVVRAASGRTVKVILETALLSDEEKVRACLLAKQAGAHYVKTSTGFSSGGATVEDVALMRKTVGPDMGVKVSGGIRNTETALAMKKAGATRIGASASIAIAGGKPCPRQP